MSYQHNSIRDALSLLEHHGYKIEAPAEKFKPRENNWWYCSLTGVPMKTGALSQFQELQDYRLFATRRDALEFDRLRKQMAIQFEFLNQYDPSYVPDWTDDSEDKWFVYYSHGYESWSCLSSIDVNPFGQMTVVYMPYEVASKFCNMANAGLIEGLEV